MKTKITLVALFALCTLLGCSQQKPEAKNVAAEKPMWVYQTESKSAANNQSSPRMSDIYTQMMINGEKIDGVAITPEFIQRLKTLEDAWDMVGGTNAYNDLCNKLLPYTIAFLEDHGDESLNALVKFHNENNLPIVAGSTLLCDAESIKDYYITYYAQVNQKYIDYLKEIQSKIQTASK